ncbi:Cro/CI family transcriptional regulator [Avibacterium paragallinarum]|uniref:Cro/CI family transcriptional regulator n=1 Tax=Avibacterium paragallinarum TaxID=728 RepID=UPI0021F71B51|nr:Cro/CI family transcriptional regulator [Avibacterium paragallinarum]UXN34384.1 Cro/CI family transcriptional regulator [Avibacterium paragallinarum]
MNRIPLSDYVKTYGQAATAKAVGVTQGAISKALDKARNIFVIPDETGKIRAEEVRPFPSKK